MEAKLESISSNQKKLDFLRLQIDMRVIGLGFVEFKTAWSSSSDPTVGTVEDLSAQLRDIIIDEEDRRVCNELPDAAVVPVMKRKTFKELGTPTAQAEALGNSIKELSPPRGAPTLRQCASMSTAASKISAGCAAALPGRQKLSARAPACVAGDGAGVGSASFVGTEKKFMRSNSTRCSGVSESVKLSSALMCSKVASV